MSVGLPAGAGRGRARGRRASSEGPPVGHLALCSRIRSLTGTRAFLALAGERSARAGDSRRARRKGFVASTSPLGCGARWGLWVGQPGKGCSPWEEAEVGKCFVARDPALCEMKHWLWDGGLGILDVEEGCA